MTHSFYTRYDYVFC